MFNTADVEKDGTLTKDELIPVLTDLGYGDLDDAYLSKVLQKFDVDGSGHLGKEE